MLGQAKGVLCSVVSVLIFHNPVSIAAAGGYAITVFGVFMYGETKRRARMEKDARADLSRLPQYLPLPDAGSSQADGGAGAGGGGGAAAHRSGAKDASRV